MSEAVAFERIGGLLTGDRSDEAVVRFAAAVARRSGARGLLFQTAPRLTVPQEVFDDEVLRAWVAREGGEPLAASTEVIRDDEAGIDEVLRMTSARSLDLLVVGRRLPAAQSRSAAAHHRLARKLPCSMLLVSRHSRPRFERIVVPVDFSPHAALAVRAALRLRDPGSRERIVCVHVLTVPYGYTYSGRTVEEFAAELRRQAEERFAAFLAEESLEGDSLEAIYTVSEHAADAVADVAQARGADMVMIGSRGHSRAASILLGSTTDDLVGNCATATLVVKRKGETAGILAALLGI